MTDVNRELEISYKLGALEAAVQHLSETVTTSIRRIEKKIDDSAKNQEDKVLELAKRVEKNELRLDDIQDWKDSIVIKLGFAASAISLFWVVFTEPIQHVFTGLF